MGKNTQPEQSVGSSTLTPMQAIRATVANRYADPVGTGKGRTQARAKRIFCIAADYAGHSTSAIARYLQIPRASVVRYLNTTPTDLWAEGVTIATANQGVSYE